MGNYLNPGNSGFAEVRRSLYIDKSGLINQMNQVIGTMQKLTCISRPRRFGKSFAAKMLCAYYDKSCDSSGLFEDLAVAKDEQYLKHLNKYDVIYLDMTNVISEAGREEIVPYIRKKVSEELVNAYPGLKTDPESFTATLVNAVEFTGNKIVAIIDEWDAPIREVPAVSKEYLEFLRSLFKNSGATDKIFAAGYMTGILPIKKDGSQSAISDFQEFSMIFPSRFAEYVGFTEEEVQKLCDEYGKDFSMMKQWYDGYSLEGVGSIYNPNSVMQAMRNNKFRSYWTETSTAKSLREYISLDFDGLSKTIAGLLGGIEVTVDTNGFANDLVTFRNRDDVLTLLIHLGYLAYNEDTEKVHIPNEEIRREFAKTIREVKRDETIRRVRESDQLIYDTVHRNAEAVAAQIEKIHAEETAVLFYNDEQALRSVIKLAYFSYKDHYLKFEELPAGDGYADIVYLPKKNSILPVLVIEMKWNKSAEGAIAQIKNKHYPDAVKGDGGDILLVGINYDKDAPAGKRKHECVIESC
ncbi:MAG: AAA family ATPase [Roseburia sp.]|nr:AAA family ATPase [Roseburia sp.]